MADHRVPTFDLHVLPSRFVLQLLLASVMTGALGLVGGVLLEATSMVEDDPPLNCATYQVGSPGPANTHINLRNDGPRRVPVRLDLVGHDGRGAQLLGYGAIVDAGASSSFVFRAPALGAAVELISPNGRLKASVEIHPEDEGPPEIRTPIPCRAPWVPPD